MNTYEGLRNLPSSKAFPPYYKIVKTGFTWDDISFRCFPVLAVYFKTIKKKKRKYPISFHCIYIQKQLEGSRISYATHNTLTPITTKTHRSDRNLWVPCLHGGQGRCLLDPSCCMYLALIYAKRRRHIKLIWQSIPVSLSPPRRNKLRRPSLKSEGIFNIWPEGS